MRECAAIGAEERIVQRLVNTGWTYAERRDATLYQAGQVVEFHRGSWSLAQDRQKRVRFNRDGHIVESCGSGSRSRSADGKRRGGCTVEAFAGKAIE